MNIKNTVTFIFILSLFLSCTNNFFEFDEIEYYKIKVTHDDLHKVNDSVAKYEIKSKYSDIVQNDYPTKVEQGFEKILLENGFEKKIINKSIHNEINRLFREKTCLFSTRSACIPTYRDILIFKKNNKTVGIAKICFDCEISHIVGTSKDVDNFGQCGDYQKLHDILK